MELTKMLIDIEVDVKKALEQDSKNNLRPTYKHAGFLIAEAMKRKGLIPKDKK